MRKVIGAVAASVLALAVAPAGFAQAQEEPAPSDVNYTIDVSVGLQGYAHPDEPIPIVVDITSEELIVGRLDIGAGGTTVRTAIEIPANSAKQYVVYGAPPGDRRTVTVNLVRVVDGEDEVLERQSIRLVLPSGELLVGLLGSDGLTTALRSAVSSPLATEIVPLPVSGAALARCSGITGFSVLEFQLQLAHTRL